jgi:CheY-like chemotaxis protein
MENHNQSKKRVLIVEDEPSITRVFQRVIKGMGLTEETAANGLIAQEMLEHNDYDLLIFDIRTPQMNGKELFLWLKYKYPGKADKVVFTSGDIMSGNTQSFLEESQRPFLPKPFTPKELRIFINQNLERKG